LFFPPPKINHEGTKSTKKEPVVTFFFQASQRQIGDGRLDSRSPRADYAHDFFNTEPTSIATIAPGKIQENG